MVIERMSIVWEERGPSEAIVEGIGSMAVASTAYLVMSVREIQHLLFVFPELLLRRARGVAAARPLQGLPAVGAHALQSAS